MFFFYCRFCSVLECSVVAFSFESFGDPDLQDQTPDGCILA